MSLTHHDYCAGTGAFSIASALAGFTTTVIIEKKPHAIQLLKRRFPTATFYTDLKTTDPALLDTPTLLTAGIPCQPYSIAGERLTLQDPRHLWPTGLKFIKRLRPAWVVIENVDDFASVELDLVRLDLAKENYQSTCFVLPAVAAGTPHRRDRLYIVAHTMSDRVERSQHSTLQGFEGIPWFQNFRSPEILTTMSMSFEPKLCRSLNDVPRSMDRLDLLGEAIIPDIANKIISLIAYYERNR